MAKTIMIANEIYDKLKSIKGDYSFSEVIGRFLEEEAPNGARLVHFVGTLKGDKEYDNVMKENKKHWKKWPQKYA